MEEIFAAFPNRTTHPEFKKSQDASWSANGQPKWGVNLEAAELGLGLFLLLFGSWLMLCIIGPTNQLFCIFPALANPLSRVREKQDFPYLYSSLLEKKHLWRKSSQTFCVMKAKSLSYWPLFCWWFSSLICQKIFEQHATICSQLPDCCG